MKALKFLTKLKQSRDFDGNLEYSLDEAISELEEAMNLTRREWYQKGFNEAMKQRTCEGCRYGAFGVNGLGFEVECRIGYNCSRGREDRYEPKDNK